MKLSFFLLFLLSHSFSARDLSLEKLLSGMWKSSADSSIKELHFIDESVVRFMLGSQDKHYNFHRMFEIDEVDLDRRRIIINVFDRHLFDDNVKDNQQKMVIDFVDPNTIKLYTYFDSKDCQVSTLKRVYGISYR